MKFNEIFLSFFFILLLASPATAQNKRAGAVDTETLAKDTLSSSEADIKPEEAPIPEAPYPNAKSDEPGEPASGQNAQPNSGQKSLPVTKTLTAPQKISKPQVQSPLKIERPQGMEEDGAYLYGRSDEDDARNVDDMKLPRAGPGPK